MPIYEYRCDDCGELFEKIQKFTDEPLKKCELCGGKAHRIISKSTFILKGTGWYVTDYASKNRNSNGSTDQSDSSKTPTDVPAATSNNGKEKSEKKEPKESERQSHSKNQKKNDSKPPPKSTKAA